MKRNKKLFSDTNIANDATNSQSDPSLSESILNGKISRRQALSTGAKAAIGVGVVVVVGAAGYAAYTSVTPGTTSATTSAASTSASSVTTTLPTTSTAAASSNTNITPLTFVHWHYRDDRVTSYVNQFMQENNENVVQETLDNANYNPLIEAKFQSGETFDMNYANVFEANRLIKLGYTKPVEGFDGISQIKSEMYPSIVDAYSTKDGKLAGLPYFWSARSAPVVNDVIMDKANLSGQRPGTWDELWSLAAKIKSSGAADKPVLPHWFNANYGIMWDFLGEMSNAYNDPDLTKTLFDKTFAPVFDTNSSAADLLQKWQTATKNGLVDTAIFSMGGDDPFVTASLTGNYAFVPTAIYYFKSMNDPSSSKIPVGKANLVPVKNQGWGVIDTGLYCWPVKNHDDQRSQKLIKYLGYKNPKTGKRLTQTAWAETDALGSGYTDTLQDPDVKTAFNGWLGDRTDATLKTISDIANSMGRPFIFKATMYSPLADQFFPVLSAIASGGTDVKTGVTQLRAAADALFKQYGSA
jgi:ABC-type glycerol-3-phosphate transport system substrate-binding protein